MHVVCDTPYERAEVAGMGEVVDQRVDFVCSTHFVAIEHALD
jgi:hypothetical protein